MDEKWLWTVFPGSLRVCRQKSRRKGGLLLACQGAALRGGRKPAKAKEDFRVWRPRGAEKQMQKGGPSLGEAQTQCRGARGSFVAEADHGPGASFSLLETQTDREHARPVPQGQRWLLWRKRFFHVLRVWAFLDTKHIFLLKFKRRKKRGRKEGGKKRGREGEKKEGGGEKAEGKGEGRRKRLYVLTSVSHWGARGLHTLFLLTPFPGSRRQIRDGVLMGQLDAVAAGWTVIKSTWGRWDNVSSLSHEDETINSSGEGSGGQWVCLTDAHLRHLPFPEGRTGIPFDLRGCPHRYHPPYFSIPCQRKIIFLIQRRKDKQLRFRLMVSVEKKERKNKTHKANVHLSLHNGFEREGGNVPYSFDRSFVNVLRAHSVLGTGPGAGNTKMKRHVSPHQEFICTYINWNFYVCWYGTGYGMQWTYKEKSI